MHFLGYPVIDMHVHLRNNIPLHTRAAFDSNIDLVVYMANTKPPMDNLEAILLSKNEKRYCYAFPVSAITKGLDGKELVDVERIKEHVVGFSDDGKCLTDLEILKEILKKRVLVLLHCNVSYDKPETETEMINKYLGVLAETGGLLHFQHISLKSSVITIREAKKDGLVFTCETAPHYFTFSKDELDTKVNPPLASVSDVEAVREGLADGTIDVIASDYAPLPRPIGTGIAGFKSFIPLSHGLVLQKVLGEEQLKGKLYSNPKKIIESSGFIKIII